MTGAWEPADWTPVLRHRRRRLVRRSLTPFVDGTILLGARALVGLSLLTFGVVTFLRYSAVVALRAGWSPRARARWEAQVRDHVVFDHALTTRDRVVPELHERVTERARKLDSDAVLTTTLRPLGVVIVVGAGLSEWAPSLSWVIAGILGATVVVGLVVLVSARRARPARRWLADPPPPLVPDDATHHG